MSIGSSCRGGAAGVAVRRAALWGSRSLHEGRRGAAITRQPQQHTSCGELCAVPTHIKWLYCTAGSGHTPKEIMETAVGTHHPVAWQGRVRPTIKAKKIYIYIYSQETLNSKSCEAVKYIQDLGAQSRETSQMADKPANLCTM